jgi:hypothetical protein
MKKILLILTMLFFTYHINAQALMICGGKNHDVFIGCMNCGKFDSKSIWNAYGDYGSKFNSNCIWNKFGDYGGKFSDYSPFNKFANYPPVVVDKEGNFYGYLTINEYQSNRNSSQIAIAIYNFWEFIQEDPGEAYDKIFSR